MRQNSQAREKEDWLPAVAARAGAERRRAVPTAPEPEPTARVAVGLHRTRLVIEEPGGYFKLKMMLVRTLRRGFKTSILEVDDAEPSPDAGAETELFTVKVEPSDAKDHARAVRTVRRVLRSRRWLR